MTQMCALNDQLPKNDANFTALSPLSFLRRAATVYANSNAVIYGDRRYSWRETYDRCTRLGALLQQRGIARGDVVSVMLPNIPAMYEAHFAIPMTGAVLNAINIRLDKETVAFILQHSSTKLIICDTEYRVTIEAALATLDNPPPVIFVHDTQEAFPEPPAEYNYETLLAAQRSAITCTPPQDEWDAIALGYTSGTTGNPKGVVTHHRGAYLNAVSNVLSWGMGFGVRYLWTLPMFHCNGWCFPWTLAAIGGTSICMRKVDAQVILSLIEQYKVSHYCGAPIVHAMMADAIIAQGKRFEHKLSGLIAGAAPPASVFEKMATLGIDITHVYGLTEVYGPATVCVKQDTWQEASLEEQVHLNGRQGVNYPMEEDVCVMDPNTMLPVPADGETVGEIMFRGNIVMKGYLNNPKATAEAFHGGWFHSGDLGVCHPDGYLKIVDRSKDIIISGGENISSLEVEDVVMRHAEIELAAVVPMADEKWGEVPVVFAQKKVNSVLTEEQLIQFCRERMSHFKAPRKVVFQDIPTTSTGKIQKFALRQQLNQSV